MNILIALLCSVITLSLHSSQVTTALNDRHDTTIEEASDVNSRNKWGVIPLAIALREDLDEAQSLLNRGADINAKTKGHTVLMDAVLEGDDKAIEFIIVNNANVNEISDEINDFNGISTLLAPHDKDYTEIIKLLVEAGAHTNIVKKTSIKKLAQNICNSKLHTALDLAILNMYKRTNKKSQIFQAISTGEAERERYTQEKLQALQIFIERIGPKDIADIIHRYAYGMLAKDLPRPQEKKDGITTFFSYCNIQ